MSEQELKNGQVYLYMDQYETLEANKSYSKIIEGFKAFNIRLNGKPVGNPRISFSCSIN